VPAHPGARTAAFAAGDRIGRYIVLGRLGQGGMGVVLSAYDPQLDRKVAIKVLRTGTGVAAGEGRARMIREAKAIAQLSHPNVVAVYDVGTADPGDVYIAMEFVEGDTLTAWQRRFDRPWREVLDVFLQAGRGLSAAHGAGLLHRDFKPDNVLVGADGRVRVGDFGLARTMVGPDDGRVEPPVVAAALQGSLTATGAIVGTPRYMAPETFRGKDSDARSDQFSYCTALYEALFGRHPLEDGTAIAMVERGVAAMPPPEGHKVPASIVRAVLRGLEDVPAKRFPSMGTLIAELTPPPSRAPRRVVMWLAAGLVLVGAATAVALSWGDGEQPKREKDLVEQIKQKDAKIAELVDRLARAEKDAAEKPVLVKQIEDLRKERDALLEEVQINATVEPPDIGTLPPEIVKRPKPDVTKKALEALAQAPVVVPNCFSEWAERHPNTDAHVTVSLKVSPDGISHSVIARGVDDAVLPICVEDAVRDRIKVPAPGMILELAVDLHYVGGAVTAEPRLTGSNTGGKKIDLDELSRPRQGPLIDQ
jgi:serine/threonine protein kinase